MIQLRIKTEYSFGQTYASLERVIQRLKDTGCTAAGIVDQSTWGHVKWHSACLAAGIQPILGVEIAVSDDDYSTKMWFLAKNPDGLKELYRWTSLSHSQPIRSKGKGAVPRLYTDQIEAMSKTNNIVIFAGDVTDGSFLYDVNAVLDLNPGSLV
jgi:DNA polymerase III alpha subunit